MNGVVVLGMHRSGTSAVTRVLHLLGAAIPSRQDLLTAYDNPDGHWESRTLVGCNDRILDAFGRSWDFPPWLAPGWEQSSAASAMLPDLSAAFSSVYDGGLWVWKDPRTCLTLPLWRRALGDDLAVVLVHRSATAVTTSIHRRDGIPRIYSAGLWLHYLRCSLEGARGLPTVCLDFSDMQRSPEPTTTFLQQALGSLGVGLDGDVVAAAGSIHAPGRPDHGQRGRIDALVRRVTARAAGLLAELPPVSTAFSPPALAEPSWVRPLLFAYRGPWALRARLGHPLGPRFA